jgi:hypothetical protein
MFVHCEAIVLQKDLLESSTKRYGESRESFLFLLTQKAREYFLSLLSKKKSLLSDFLKLKTYLQPMENHIQKCCFGGTRSLNCTRFHCHVLLGIICYTIF